MNEPMTGLKVSSDKLYNLKLKLNESNALRLPKNKYGPICLKIMHDFIEFHKLPKDLPLPCPGLLPHESLGRIFDILLYSLGKEKRDEILKECDIYFKDVSE
jgi:hypothetical protein